MICIPNSDGPELYGKRMIESELNGVNVSINTTSVECEEEYNFSYFKTFFWILVTAYLAITFQSTKYYYRKMVNSHWPKSKYEKCYEIFSVTKNAQKLWQKNRNSDFQRLKSIQGIRVFNTIVVVFWHTAVSLFEIYADDIEQLEKSYEYPFFFYMMFLGAFCVQMFFLISTFLLTNQVYELHENHGRFTLRDCFILLINRLFRFLPTLLLATAVTRIGVYDHCPHTVKPLKLYMPACLENWVYTLLQVNFLLPFDKMCTPGFWYLSVDTLYYSVTILILYLVTKCHWNIKKLVVGLMVLSTIYFGARIYGNGWNFMFQPYPETLKNIIRSETMNHVYIPPMASWPSSLIGIILGYIYYRNKGTLRVSLCRKLRILWWLSFVCIPLTVLHISTYSYRGILAGIIGAILKPIFVLPLGIGILGMAFGLGGIVKVFLESNILMILSNVTYCTYVFHFLVVFAKGLFLTDLFHYESNHLFFWFVFDVVASFTMGIVCTILIEYPGYTLQKMILPQIKKTRSDKVNGLKAKLT